MRLETEPKYLTFGAFLLCAKPRQGSSVVEQGTHKPLVGSSPLPPGMLSQGVFSVPEIDISLESVGCFLSGFPIRLVLVVVLVLEGRSQA